MLRFTAPVPVRGWSPQPCRAGRGDVQRGCEPPASCILPPSLEKTFARPRSRLCCLKRKLRHSPPSDSPRAPAGRAPEFLADCSPPSPPLCPPNRSRTPGIPRDLPPAKPPPPGDEHGAGIPSGTHRSPCPPLVEALQEQAGDISRGRGHVRLTRSR